MNFNLSTTERLLLAACSGALDPRLVDDYRSIGDEAAWTAAEEHELTGHLAHKLAGLGEPVPERWVRAHEATAQRVSAYLNEMDRVAAGLAPEGIPVVALKNAGIARGVYRCLGCSPMGDVDVLVRRRDFPAVHGLLTASGYTCASRDPFESGAFAAGELSGGLEYSRDLPGAGEFWLELQWRPVAGRWIRPDQEPAGDDLIARSLPIAGSNARILSPEDNLLQVCLHTAKHSYLRAPGLRLHCDVDRIVRNVAVDWPLFTRRVEELRVKTAVYFSLAIPAAGMATPIPHRVLDSLRPPARKERAIWRAILAAGLFHPKRRKFTAPAYLRFNALLYDRRRDLLRAVFPDVAWMKQRYAFRSSLWLPLYHARRWYDLAFQRTGI